MSLLVVPLLDSQSLLGLTSALSLALTDQSGLKLTGGSGSHAQRDAPHRKIRQDKMRVCSSLFYLHPSLSALLTLLQTFL